MPKWACRLWLKVKDTRAERIQDISDRDIYSEGVQLLGTRVQCLTEQGRALRRAMAHLWDSLYGPGAWDRNDYVWRTEFEVKGAG